MNLIGDYHTHTLYSHGKGSIRENVEVAIDKGLKEIAICDHGPGHYGFGVKRGDLAKMRMEVDQLNIEYKGKIKVLLGLEANIIGFDGTLDVDDDIIGYLDILLVGYHYGILPKSLRDGLLYYILNPISKLVPPLNKRLLDLNTRAFVKAIKKYNIYAITHPGAKVPLNIEVLARECVKTKTKLEINVKHGELSVENLKLAAKTGVKFLVSSDAHRPEDVGNVSKSIERAKEAEIPLDRVSNIV